MSGFITDYGQFDSACRVCTTPEECDNGGCLAFGYCPDCGEREDECRCAVGERP